MVVVVEERARGFGLSGRTHGSQSLTTCGLIGGVCCGQWQHILVRLSSGSYYELVGSQE